MQFLPAILAARTPPLLPEGTVISATGRIWMDRNLGASRVATSLTDAAAYGDLYQQGRLAGGHEKRSSPITSTTSYTDKPDHGCFTTPQGGYNDWRNPHNINLWQGIHGVNNPCPAGFRLPTAKEFSDEIKTWRSYNPEGAFASPLKLIMAGYRSSNGELNTDSIFYGIIGPRGQYWTSTMQASGPSHLFLAPETATISTLSSRAEGGSVRCIKD